MRQLLEGRTVGGLEGGQKEQELELVLNLPIHEGAGCCLRCVARVEQIRLEG